MNLIALIVNTKFSIMKIEPQSVVSLTYDLYVKQEDGSEVLQESATEEQPLTFLFGAGQMLPKFEENLSTLSTGDSYEFSPACGRCLWRV